MTETPPSTELISAPQPAKLPATTVIDLVQPAPTGWVAWYHDATIKRVIGLPVLMWVLVEYEDAAEDRQEIRPFVATDSGRIIDYMDLPHDLLCVLGPMIPDHRVVLMQHLQARGLQIPDGPMAPNGAPTN